MKDTITAYTGYGRMFKNIIGYRRLKILIFEIASQFM